MIVANSKEKSKKYSKKIEIIFICLQNERVVHSKNDSPQVGETPDIVGTHIGNVQAANSLRAMGVMAARICIIIIIVVSLQEIAHVSPSKITV